MTKPQKPTPKILMVKEVYYLTPHMIRIVLTGPELENVSEDCPGANCKIFPPEEGMTKEAFAGHLNDASVRPVVRTYTIRSFDKKRREIVIDFVAHGDNGPASKWAMNAKAGDFLGMRGPSAPKIDRYYADWYLLAADMSALPVVSATLEAMPKDAKGVAIFEVQTEADIQELDMPSGIKAHWIIQSNPNVPSTAQIDFIRAMDWSDGVCQTCIAGESGVIKAIRQFLTAEAKLPRKDVYISGYWKIGLIEDEHQIEKRAESAA